MDAKFRPLLKIVISIRRPFLDDLVVVTVVFPVSYFRSQEPGARNQVYYSRGGGGRGEVFPIKFLDATKSVLLRVFTVIETTCKKIWACPLPKIEKNLLSVDVRGLKMLLLEHTNRFERCLSTGSALFAFFGSGFALKGRRPLLWLACGCLTFI